MDAEVMRAALEQAREMVLFYGKDGTISYANESAETLLSYDSGLIGHNVLEIYPGVFRDRDGVLELNRSLELDGFTMDAYRENRTCFPTVVRIAGSRSGACFSLSTFPRTYIWSGGSSTSIRKNRRLPKSSRSLSPT